jgi:hypothetical protein
MTKNNRSKISFKHIKRSGRGLRKHKLIVRRGNKKIIGLVSDSNVKYMKKMHFMSEKEFLDHCFEIMKNEI